MTRVLIVTPDFPPGAGGIGTHCFEMAKHWSRSVDVTVITPETSRGRRATDLGFSLREFKWSANPAVRNWRLVQCVRRVMQEQEIDLFYIGHWRASAAAMRVAALTLRTRPAYIQAIHGSEVLYLLRPGLGNRLHRWLFQRVTSRAASFIALGSYQVQILQQLGINLDRVFLSPEGVDLSAIDNVDPGLISSLRKRLSLQGKRVILTVGRLVERKGQDMVIKALPAITEKVPNTVYLIVGTGPNESALRRLIDEIGLPQDRVHFCGYVPPKELSAYYSMCDVFVMPNRELEGDTEGFGIVFLEAGAQRKPCVGGRSGGAGDAIIDGTTGFLVDPHSPTAIAQAVVTLFHDPRLSARLGAAARQRIEKEFQYQSVARRILDQCISVRSFAATAAKA